MTDDNVSRGDDCEARSEDADLSRSNREASRDTHTYAGLARFSCEERLQEVLAANPHLMMSSALEVPIMLMGREVGIRGEIAGGMQDESVRYVRHRRPDLLVVDVEGILTVVEVKLEKNRGLDAAVQQALDYAKVLFDSSTSSTANLMEAFRA